MQEICERCDREAKEQQFTTLESERSQNRGLNRYRDVNPYDHSRIILKRGKVDYINANLVKVSCTETGKEYFTNTLDIYFAVGTRRSAIYTDTGSSAGYCGSFLAYGLGAKFTGNSNAQQADREATNKMPSLLARSGGLSTCAQTERCQFVRGVGELRDLSELCAKMVQVSELVLYIYNNSLIVNKFRFVL